MVDAGDDSPPGEKAKEKSAKYLDRAIFLPKIHVTN
jgi:hypothetical protein